VLGVDSDTVIDFLNEKKKYEKTIEELNEKIEKYEKNSKIMEGKYFHSLINISIVNFKKK